MKTKTKKPEIEFDAEALVARVEAFVAGRAPSRVRTLKVPPPIRAIPAKEIRAIRAMLGCTQVEFAALLNVPKVTAVSWENGTRKPSGAALRLLVETSPRGVGGGVREAGKLLTDCLAANGFAGRCVCHCQSISP